MSMTREETLQRFANQLETDVLEQADELRRRSMRAREKLRVASTSLATMMPAHLRPQAYLDPISNYPDIGDEPTPIEPIEPIDPVEPVEPIDPPSSQTSRTVADFSELATHLALGSDN